MAEIVIVEDHSIVREGIRSFLHKTTDHTVVAETGNGLEALSLVEKHRPDIAIVDLRLPGLDGLEVIRRIRSDDPVTRIIVLSMHANFAFIMRAFEYGANAYVLKNSAAEELTQAVEAALEGRRFVSSQIDQDPQKREISDPYDSLTPRERETLQLVGEGLTASEIADRLYISSRTVEKHRSNLMKKLDLHNHAEVVRYALERGLVPFRLPDAS
jgi:RNA polymerase sigma factor (sigma-70 family)